MESSGLSGQRRPRVAPLRSPNREAMSARCLLTGTELAFETEVNTIARRACSAKRESLTSSPGHIAGWNLRRLDGFKGRRYPVSPVLASCTSPNWVATAGRFSSPAGAGRAATGLFPMSFDLAKDATISASRQLRPPRGDTRHVGRRSTASTGNALIRAGPQSPRRRQDGLRRRAYKAGVRSFRPSHGD